MARARLTPRVAAAIVNGVLLGAAVVTVAPLVWMLSVSFMSPGEASAFPPPLVPGHPTLANYRELFALLGGITEAARQRSIPFWLAEGAGRLLRWRARLTGIAPVITDEVVRIYRHDWAYSSERAMSELGYRITPLEEGLRRTISWLAEQKR